MIITDNIFVKIFDLVFPIKGSYPNLLLVGGCSRSGKSFIVKILQEQFKLQNLNSLNISMDLWLKPISARVEPSIVTERYRLQEFHDAIEELILGRTVKVIAYNAQTRELDLTPLKIEPPCQPYVLIVDGVIALASEYLRVRSSCNLFVNINDCVRIKRLILFYRDFKKIPKKVYKKIIKNRENEEVPYVKNTMRYAHITLTQ